MKIKPRHIKKFEAFIQNSKNTNPTNTEDAKTDKRLARLIKTKNQKIMMKAKVTFWME